MKLKTYILISSFFFLFNCKKEETLNKEKNSQLNKILIENINSTYNIDLLNSFNDSIKKYDFYELRFLIEDSLGSYNYDIEKVSTEQIFPDISNLTICYKSKDSILINNLFVKDNNLDLFINYIMKDDEVKEVFTEFLISETVSDKMNMEEWQDCINYLKVVLNKMTIIQKNKNIKFRVLLVFKTACFLQPGPPPM
jgi:hypothetical protein